MYEGLLSVGTSGTLMSSYVSCCIEVLFLQCLYNPQVLTAPMKTPTIKANRNVETVETAMLS